MKTLLIDGTNIAHIHFAANPALDGDGNPAGIIKGFMGLLSRANALYRPDRIVCFWDGPGGSLQRRRLYKGYKEGRKPRSIVGSQYQFATPEQANKNYDWQTNIVRNLASLCGVCSIITDNYEADDGIAYLSLESKYDEEFLIVSCDKDFYQLIDKNIKIYNPISKEIIDEDWVLNKFSVHPKNWLFYRSISGDPSDNLLGVKGFGSKTLTKLFSLNKNSKIYPDNILQSVEFLNEQSDLDSKTKRIQKRLTELKEGIEIIERNFKLMDLSNPLMALEAKESIDFQLRDFVPSISQKNFYIEMRKLDLGINPMMPNEFGKLKS